MKHATKKRHQGQALNRFSFKLSPVAAGCAVLLFGMTEIASAQEAATNTVVVTGIRRGIEEAISVKKNATSIVEAISAEDIGKLPDSSIAEAISRLPGVTAQRTAGRAQAISVRGMSPDFATALLNGREQTSTGDSRSVYFDQFPSELLSGVVVHKSPEANLIGQGLSGTIDLQTVRPLDFGKRTIAANYRKERMGAGTDNPGSGSRASLSYIDQFADRKLGVALGFARLDGTSGTTTKFESWGSGTTTYNGQTVNVPYNGFNAASERVQQTRDGAMAVVQFKPSKEFSSTLDLFYSKFDSVTAKNILQVPLNDSWSSPTGVYDRPGVLSNAVLSGNNVVSGTFNNVRPVVRNEPVTNNESMTSIGWKNDLTLSGGWKLTADLNRSTAKRVERDLEVYAGVPGDASKSNAMFSSFTFDTAGGARKFSTNFDYSNPAIIKITDGQGWGGGVNTPQAGYSKGPTVNDKIEALRLSAKKDLPEGSWFTDVDFGANYSKRSKVREVNEFLLQVASGPFGGLDIPGGTTAMAGDTGIPMLAFTPGTNIPGLNFVEKQHPDIWNKDWRVEEKVTTAYAKANLETEIAKMPLTGNIGVQLVKTEQSSTAYSINKDAGNNSSAVAPFTAGKSYNDVLPSMNLSLDLGNQQVVRFALAKIMARPTMDDMKSSNGFSVNTQKNIYSGGGGNPTLDPFRATGVDISYEKYFGNKAYFSAAAFYKNLDSYIVSITNPNYDFTRLITPTTIKLPSNIGEFTTPTNGTGGSIKGVEVAASLPFNMVHKVLDGFGAVGNFSNTSSSLNMPNTTEGNSGGKMELPGLSKRVGSLTFYYEKHGFSFRVAQRYRSDFVGEVIGFGGDRTKTYIKGEKVLDAQLGYEFDTGFAKGLSLLLQVNNLTNTPFIRFKQKADGSTEEIENTKYGKTILLGVNYKM